MDGFRRHLVHFVDFLGVIKTMTGCFIVIPSWPRICRHSVKTVALTESIRWLQSLHIENLESIKFSDQGGTKILGKVIEFINSSNLLPHGAKIGGITSKEIFVHDGNGNPISLEQMSDGYRSILSLTFELLRQMFKVYGSEFVLSNIDTELGSINVTGVVAIDEIDAHLHPAWQKQIGEWFLSRFPKIQFIVTTHSPLVCRAAGLRGSIWRLPVPGTNEKAKRVEDVEFDRLVYGDILDAYSTDFFGVNVTRSAQSQELVSQLASLNLKKATVGLSAAEEEQVVALRGILPSSSPVIPGKK